jgi:hypothetical protein
MLGVLATVAGFALGPRLMQLGLRIELPNEGWNAIHAIRWANGEALYPKAGSWLVNNYPPLWFWLIGTLGAWTGDTIIAARYVAVAAFFAAGAGVVAVARCLGAGWFASLAGGAFFVATLAGPFGSYVGLAEPQMLAHAVMLGGAAVALGARNRTGIVIAVLICVTAGLIKHNIFALPLAMTVWLWLHRRELFAYWLATGAIAVILALATFVAIYDSALIWNLSYPRVLRPRRILTGLGHVSKVIVVLVIWAGLLLRLGSRRDPAIDFVTLALGAAILEIVLLGGALGVSFNIAFDLVIAGALALAVALDAIGRRVRATWPWWGAVILVLVTVRIAVGINAEARNGWSAATQTRYAEVAAESAAVIARIRSVPGPVLCEPLALCVWAGKLPGIDLWKLRFESTLSPTVRPDSVIAHVAAGNEAIAVLMRPIEGSQDDRMLPGLFAALRAVYPEREDFRYVTVFRKTIRE